MPEQKWYVSSKEHGHPRWTGVPWGTHKVCSLDWSITATPRKSGVSARMQSKFIAKHIVSFREGFLCKMTLSSARFLASFSRVLLLQGMVENDPGQTWSHGPAPLRTAVGGRNELPVPRPLGVRSACDSIMALPLPDTCQPASHKWTNDHSASLTPELYIQARVLPTLRLWQYSKINKRVDLKEKKKSFQIAKKLDPDCYQHTKEDDNYVTRWRWPMRL